MIEALAYGMYTRNAGTYVEPVDPEWIHELWRSDEGLQQFWIEQATAVVSELVEHHGWGPTT